MNKRKEIEILIKDIDKNKQKLEQLAYELYKEEIGDTLDMLDVEMQGYKKVLRRLGFVI